MSIPPAPDLYGKGKIPEFQSFAEEWYSKWNIDEMSVGKIRKSLIGCMFLIK
jgi:hypothetical protein